MDELKNKPRDGALFLDQGDRQEDPSRFAGDGKAEEAAEILEELVNLMDLEVRVEVRSDAERIELDVTGEDSGRAIGKKGATLDALQFLINKMVNRFPEGRRHVVVDSGDYRERHDDGLVSMAKRQAERAVNEGKVITLQPMNARDRRVIHMSLAKFDGGEHDVAGRGHAPPHSDHPRASPSIAENRSRRAARRHRVVEPPHEIEVGAFIEPFAGGQHPDFRRERRTDASPVAGREGRTRHRYVEGLPRHVGRGGIDPRFEHTRAVAEAERAHRGAQERGSNASRLDQGSAKGRICRKNRQKRRANPSADVEERRSRWGPARGDELDGVDEEDLGELLVGPRGREVGARPPRLREPEVVEPRVGRSIPRALHRRSMASRSLMARARPSTLRGAR